MFPTFAYPVITTIIKYLDDKDAFSFISAYQEIRDQIDLYNFPGRWIFYAKKNLKIQKFDYSSKLYWNKISSYDGKIYTIDTKNIIQIYPSTNILSESPKDGDIPDYFCIKNDKVCVGYSEYNKHYKYNGYQVIILSSKTFEMLSGFKIPKFAVINFTGEYIFSKTVEKLTKYKLNGDIIVEKDITVLENIYFYEDYIFQIEYGILKILDNEMFYPSITFECSQNLKSWWIGQIAVNKDLVIISQTREIYFFSIQKQCEIKILTSDKTGEHPLGSNFYDMEIIDDRMFLSAFDFINVISLVTFELICTIKIDWPLSLLKVNGRLFVELKDHCPIIL